jgi:XTP/dITP diphosphohydrolase
MQLSYDVLFASSNKHKYKEVRTILAEFGIKVRFFNCKLSETQNDSIKKIASHKVTDAFNQCKKPVIIEDDGLFIGSLGGFPGPFSSYVFKTIGNNGILHLVNTKRNANFQSVIAYCDKKQKVLFDAKVRGKISKKIHGKGWGYDPIFIPHGQKMTFAMLKNKNKLSHRYLALRKFAKWFVHRQQSIYR